MIVVSPSNYRSVSCVILQNIFSLAVCLGWGQREGRQLARTEAAKEKRGILVNTNLLMNHLNEIGLHSQLSKLDNSSSSQ